MGKKGKEKRKIFLRRFSVVVLLVLRYGGFFRGIFSVWSMVLYGGFPYVVETLVRELKTGFRLACNLRVMYAKVVASLHFVTGLHVRTVVIWLVERSESWEDEMLQGLLWFLTCFTEISHVRGLVSDEVCKFCDILGNSKFNGDLVVWPRLDI